MPRHNDTRRSFRAAAETFATNPSATNYRLLTDRAADHQATCWEHIETLRGADWLATMERIVKDHVALNA